MEAPEHLTLQEFGPIREARISVRDLTVFVGPQATGKSLAAQTLCLLRGLERHVLPLEMKPLGETDPIVSLTNVLESWFGRPLSDYVGPATRIEWSQKGRAAEEIAWDAGGALHANPPLLERARTTVKTWRSRRLQAYVPAGRTLYSYLPPWRAVALLSQAAVSWPGYLTTFYASLGNSIQDLQRAGPPTSPEPAILARIHKLLKGTLQYDQTGGVQLSTRRRQDAAEINLPPTRLASGQMEVWPLMVILEAVSRDVFEDPPDCIYVEEPEAHLHPGAQRAVLEIIAELIVSKGQRFVLTTHSPYVLYALNNFLMAAKVKATGKSLPPRLAQMPALEARQVALCRFGSDGMASNMVDDETGLLDTGELDRVAEELGVDFTEMQKAIEDLS